VILIAMILIVLGASVLSAETPGRMIRQDADSETRQSRQLFNLRNSEYEPLRTGMQLPPVV
jgi:hypothetical protein